jgi:hypothetical protein
MNTQAHQSAVRTDTTTDTGVTVASGFIEHHWVGWWEQSAAGTASPALMDGQFSIAIESRLGHV